MKIKVNRLDIVFARYVRLRDKVCQSCGKSNGKLEAAHCYGRARKSVRYDPDNACILCFTCHQWFDHHETEKMEFFQKRLGDAFWLLQARMRTPASYMDKVAIELWLNSELEKMKEV